MASSEITFPRDLVMNRQQYLEIFTVITLDGFDLETWNLIIYNYFNYSLSISDGEKARIGLIRI